MAVGIRPMWVSVFLLALFSIALCVFALTFIGQNNPSSPAISDPTLNNTYTSIQSTLSGFQSNVSNQLNISQNDRQASTISIFLIVNSVLNVPWALMSLLSITGNAIWVFVFNEIFGANYAILSTVILGIIGGTILFVVLKFVRLGESER